MPEKYLKQRLAAILCADVKAYSRLLSQDSLSTIRTLSQHRKIFSSFIEDYNGRVVDTPGDNILADFISVSDAVNCAIEIQRELEEHNSGVPLARMMKWRIGICLGDVIDEDGQIFGDGINIAARVENLANPGGICVSGTVYDQVKGKLGLDYESLGEQKVKNIAEPVRIFRVLTRQEVVTHSEGKTRDIEKGISNNTAFMNIAIIAVVIGSIFLWIYISIVGIKSTYIFYQAAFLLVFLATATIALGSILKIWVFAKVEEKYMRVLFGFLIAQLAGTVIQAYATLPPTQVNSAEEYAYELQYLDYLDDWIKAQNVHNKYCVDRFLSSEKIPPVDCAEAVEGYLRQTKAINRIGSGRLILSYNKTSKRYNGIASYRFPDESAPTVFEVTGLKHSAEERIIYFTQPPAAIKIGDECVLRPSTQFKIGFKKDGAKFRGVLLHPELKIDDQPIVIAQASMFEG